MDWNEFGEPFFINTVIGHLWHTIPGAHYRRMFGEDADPLVYELIDQHADHVHWATSEVWTDVRKGVTDATFQAGGGHAHTGLLIYQGGNWPEYWNGKLLTINFHGRKLNVERLEKVGGSYVGRREPDAFAFADPWFRGIDLIPSPDGGIFVSDWSDTGECHDHDGIHRSSGRIFKIGYGKRIQQTPIDLTNLSLAELIELQTSSNVWMARHASRETIGRMAIPSDQNVSLKERLLEMVHSDIPVHQIRAIQILHQCRLLDKELAESMLLAPQINEHVRVCLLRCLTDQWKRNGNDRDTESKFVELVLQSLQGNSTPWLRLAIASSLQQLSVDARTPICERLSQYSEDAGDHNIPLMIWYATYPLAARQDGSFERIIAKSKIPTVSRLGMRLLFEDVESGSEGLRRIDQVFSQLDRSISKQISEALLDELQKGLAVDERPPSQCNGTPS